jgi:hypothetical protein
MHATIQPLQFSIEVFPLCLAAAAIFTNSQAASFCPDISLFLKALLLHLCDRVGT